MDILDISMLGIKQHCVLISCCHFQLMCWTPKHLFNGSSMCLMCSMGQCHLHSWTWWPVTQAVNFESATYVHRHSDMLWHVATFMYVFLVAALMLVSQIPAHSQSQRAISTNTPSATFWANTIHCCKMFAYNLTFTGTVTNLSTALTLVLQILYCLGSPAHGPPTGFLQLRDEILWDVFHLQMERDVAKVWSLSKKKRTPTNTSLCLNAYTCYKLHQWDHQHPQTFTEKGTELYKVNYVCFRHKHHVVPTEATCGFEMKHLDIFACKSKL